MRYNCLVSLYMKNFLSNEAQSITVQNRFGVGVESRCPNLHVLLLLYPSPLPSHSLLVSSFKSTSFWASDRVSGFQLVLCYGQFRLSQWREPSRRCRCFLSYSFNYFFNLLEDSKDLDIYSWSLSFFFFFCESRVYLFFL